jgi:hypothetical protein
MFKCSLSAQMLFVHLSQKRGYIVSLRSTIPHLFFESALSIIPLVAVMVFAYANTHACSFQFKCSFHVGSHVLAALGHVNIQKYFNSIKKLIFLFFNISIN